jgi:hypothetical protein
MQLVIYALQNPRLHKTREAERYDFAAVEPFLDVEHDDAVKAAWNILQIVSPTTEWASVFAQSWGNLHYAGPPQTNEYRAALISGDQTERAKLEEIRSTDELNFFREAFNRWREKSENDLSYFTYTRRNIAAAAARTDLNDSVRASLRDHEDKAVRLGYYHSFRPVDAQEIEKAFDRDRDGFVEAAIENEYFYRASLSPVVRNALDNCLDKIPHELRVRHRFLRASLEAKDPVLYLSDVDAPSTQDDSSDKWYRERNSVVYKLRWDIESILRVIGEAMDKKGAVQLTHATRRVLKKIEDAEVATARERAQSEQRRNQERETLFSYATKAEQRHGI